MNKSIDCIDFVDDERDERLMEDKYEQKINFICFAGNLMKTM